MMPKDAKLRGSCNCFEILIHSGPILCYKKHRFDDYHMVMCDQMDQLGAKRPCFLKNVVNPRIFHSSIFGMQKCNPFLFFFSGDVTSD